MNYETKTDPEINREVASYFYDKSWLSRHAEQLGMIPDYCNDPSAAWAIIVENQISLINEDRHSYWDADFITEILPSEELEFTCISACHHQDTNPLRAAMICFLKLKESENAKKI